MSELQEIRAREQAATPGPWINRPEKSFNVQSPSKNIASCFRTENAEFIAHARTDIPFLLAEIERLTAENRDLLGRINTHEQFQEEQAAELAKAKAERDAAVEFIGYLDRNYSGYMAEYERFAKWRGAKKE